jgi:hypothetical protein
MKIKKSYLIGGVIGLIILTIGLTFAGKPWGQKAVPPMPKLKPTRGVEQNLLMGLVIKVPGTGPDSYWELKVDQFTEEKKIGTMTKVEGDYFLKEKPLYHVVAQGGEIDWQSRQLRFREKVEFSSSDGKKLVAGEFWWDPVHKLVTAEHEVELSAPGFRIYTQKINANLDFKKVTFIGATRMIHTNTAR